MRLFKGFDIVLIISMVLLTVFGSFVLYSTSGSFARDQLLFSLVGLLFFFSFSFVDLRILKSLSIYLYLLNVILLFITLAFGIYSKGAIRWIPLGINGFTLQPSEFMKLSLIIYLSAFLSDHHQSQSLGDFIRSLVFLSLPFFLVFVQPDLGTSIVLVSIWLFLVVSASLKLWYLLILFFIFSAFSPILYFSLRPYQQERIRTFLSPSLDPLGSGYHVLQSKIAVGSGEIFGRGFGRGTQSHLRFLPEYHTDFIFASLSEEWGFIGSSIVIELYGLMLLRIIVVSYGTSYLFGQLLGIGILAMVLTQVMINIGMNLGIAPITGIPLPLLSSGGSSIVLTMTSLGLIESIARYGKRL